MRTKSKTAAVANILMATCLLLVFGSLLYFSYLELATRQFLEREKAVEPLFIQKNLEVWQQVSAPEGVILLESDNSHGHGSILYVWYRSETLSMDEISAYYNRVLMGMGWKILYSNLYTNGMSCFSVFSFDETNYEYRLSIQQEYFKQPFIPLMPPRWYIDIHDFGEKRFSGCSEK